MEQLANDRSTNFQCLRSRNQETEANNFISFSQQSCEGRIICHAFQMTNGSSKRLSHSFKSCNKKTDISLSQLVVEAIDWQNSFRRFGKMP